MIEKFNLNDVEFRTKEVQKVIEDILENKKIPKKNKYDNLIVDLFIDKIKDFSIEKVVKICKIIYLQISMKQK